MLTNQQQELAGAMKEFSDLSEKKSLTRQERTRITYLTTAIPLLKSGVSLDEIQLNELHKAERSAGIPLSRFNRKMTAEQRAKGQLMIDMAKGNCGGVPTRGGVEFRGETEGSILSQLGTYTGLGNFVPTDLAAVIREGMAEYDVLFDEDGPCTVTTSDNGRVTRVPVYDDTENDATQIGEAANQGAVSLLGIPGSVNLAAYSFRTPVHPVSMETFQDISDSFAFEQLFEAFATKRLARGIGQKLVLGNGSGQTTGLLTALEASGISPVVGQGSSANDGTGASATTIGSNDFENLIYSVNEVYRESPSAGFLMNSSTLASAAAVLNKFGGLLGLVNWVEGKPYILGFPVYICPSMPSLAANNISVVFGDLSYWHTRIVSGGNVPLFRVLKEAVGLIENGNYGFQAFMRADGCFAWTGQSNNAPLAFLECHS